MLHDFGGDVVDFGEGDRAGGDAARGLHHVAAGPEAGEREAGAAAGFVDDCGGLEGVEDAFDRVVQGQDEAGAELFEHGARVHQRGRVGDELEAGHQAVELVFKGGNVGVALAVLGFHGGDAVGDAVEHLFGAFDDVALLVFAEVASLQDEDGVQGELEFVDDAEERFGPSDLGAFLAVENVGLGDRCVAAFDEDAFHQVLNVLDPRDLARPQLALQLRDDFAGKLLGHAFVRQPDRGGGFPDGFGDLGRVERGDAAVSLLDLLKLCHTKNPGTDVQVGFLTVRSAVLRAEARILVTDEAPLAPAGRDGRKKGLPSFRYRNQPDEPWRSRFDMEKNVILVNNGHRDFAAARGKPASLRRYLAKLYAKEMVHLNFPDAAAPEAMERLIELLMRMEPKL